MRKAIIRAGALAALLLLLGGTVQSASAQDMNAPAPVGPEFHADIVTFQSERGSGETVVEVYFSVAHDQLAFTRTGELFRADWDLAIELDGPKGEKVFEEKAASHSTTPLYEETLSEEIQKIQRFTFVVRPGEYTLHLNMTDKVQKKAREQTYEVHVPSYSRNYLGVSDLLLADFLGNSSPDIPAGAVIDRAGTQVFTRRGHAYLPNTRGLYANFAPSLLAYYEVYGLNPLRQESNDGLYNVEFYVVNSSGETVLFYMRQHEKPGLASYNSVEMNIQDLRPGDYRLKVVARDLGTGMVAETEKPFEVLESYITLAYRDYDKAVRQLRYIASSREMSILQNAPEKDRLRLFRAFWANRDPTPETKRNESLIEYYRRIHYANDTFRAPQLEGWATDRGMVYITLGLPDHVEREDMLMDAKPRETWLYNNMRLALVFVDEAGFGDYVLQNRQEYMDRVQVRRIPPQ